MTTIRPFRGLRYNPDKFCDLSDVITMPYDRIHEPEQASITNFLYSYAHHPGQTAR